MWVGRQAYNFSLLIIGLSVLISGEPTGAQFANFSVWRFKPSFFVLTASAWTGALGGLNGARTFCQAEVIAMDWKGKSTLPSLPLTNADIDVFLCESSTCTSLRPNTTHYFARAGDTSVGGASFTTDAQGRGPNNANSWNGPTYWGTSATYWSGRAAGTASTWSNTPSGPHCGSNWNTAGGTDGIFGDPSATDSERWNADQDVCTVARRLVCIVNPRYD